MTITSKYDGKCRKCGGSITAGDTIEWSKENGSQHVTCPAQPVRSTQSSSLKPVPKPSQSSPPRFTHLEQAYKKAERAEPQRPQSSSLSPDPYWELLYQQAEREHQFAV